MPDQKDFRLRPLERTDLPFVLEWRNSDRIRANMYSDHVISSDEHKAWFRKIQEISSGVYLIFEWRDKPVGLVYFTDIDRKNNRCIWGIYLGEESLPHGTGTIMGILGIDFAFERLGIRKLCGETFAFNTAGVAFHKKLGFSQEGTYAKHVIKNGKFEDVVLFAIFSDTWPEIKQKLMQSIFSENMI